MKILVASIPFWRYVKSMEGHTVEDLVVAKVLTVPQSRISPSVSLVRQQTQVFLAVMVFGACFPCFDIELSPSSSIFRAFSAEYATFGISS
jgi:hypothetical protein